MPARWIELSGNLTEPGGAVKRDAAAHRPMAQCQDKRLYSKPCKAQDRVEAATPWKARTLSTSFPIRRSPSRNSSTSSIRAPPEQRAWVISHLLRYAQWDDIWTYVTRDEVKEIFPTLDLPENLRNAWGRMLKIEAAVGRPRRQPSLPERRATICVCLERAEVVVAHQHQGERAVGEPGAEGHPLQVVRHKPDRAKSYSQGLFAPACTPFPPGPPGRRRRWRRRGRPGRSGC